jgi:threonylcarbamoyladenosine tRNA methylthiotransferase MtaB
LFPRPIREAGSLPGVERLRLSSIEVNHLSDELIAALRETRAAALHLHVPMQSGDDGVLRAMARRYSAAHYVTKLAPLRDFNLTADVIVGFPGEDEAAFTRTLDVVREAGITRVHAFPYSPRPGTATAAADTVSAGEKKERSATLRALSDELSHRRWRSRVGSTDRVLVDRPGRGYGDDYTPWLVDGEVGQLLDARAVGVSEEGIVAVAA